MLRSLVLIGCAALAIALPAKEFGKLSDGRTANLYVLQGVDGLRLDVTDYGGRVIRLYAPDRYGNLADVTLGWNTLSEYEENKSCVGTLIGRVGNRIKDGKFSLEGREYQLAINEAKDKRHCNLHSGPDGWDSKIWKARQFVDGKDSCLELTLVSEDGDMGFPGTVTCKVTYRVQPNNVWRIDYEAVTDKTTIINPTHHAYWNLAGESSGSALSQELMIFADYYTQTDEGLIPTGDVPVKGTGFDFTKLRRIDASAEWMSKQESLRCTGGWYDHNFVLRGKLGELHAAAIMKDPVSGRKMEIWTTEPCLQMYVAQDFTSKFAAKAAGKRLQQFSGIVFETQHAPNSPNRTDCPSVVLRPGETFHSTTEYRFSAE